MTKMEQYLLDTKYATEGLFDILSQEDMSLKELEEKLSSQEQKLLSTELKLKMLEADYRGYDLSDDMNDVVLIHKHNSVERTKEEITELKAQIGDIKVSIEASKANILNHQISYDSIAMSILQIAKQGISISHGDLANCPNGREIGTTTLKDVIWQARNQAMHYEEGKLTPKVKDLFLILKNTYGSDFDISSKKSLATKVISTVLGWGNYASYKNDMSSLK